MSLPKVIALHGYARTGKDATADLLANRRYRRVAFADPIRDVLYETNPLVTVKNGDRIFIRELVDRVGWDEAKVLFPEVRQLLQGFGMACRHHIGPDVWVNTANRGIQDILAAGYGVVVTDLRFRNEAAILQETYEDQVVLVNVVRPGVGPVNNHVSDQGLPRELFDWTIVNDGTLGNLNNKIGRMLEYFSVQRAA